MSTPGSAVPDKQVEIDNFQGYDDTCFERGVSEAMELMGWILGGAAQQTAYDLYAKLYPGADRNSQGTYMSDALRGLKIATGVDGEWVNDEAGVMNALDAGKFCLLGEHDLMHDGESHFLLFLPGRGDNPQGIHCIDSDEALDDNPDVWPLATVVAAAKSLMGSNAPIGISFTLEDRNVATPQDPAPAAPETTDETLKRILAIDDQLARQMALTNEGWIRFRKGLFEGASGLDAVIVAMQGGKALDFTPSYPPKA